MRRPILPDITGTGQMFVKGDRGVYDEENYEGGSSSAAYSEEEHASDILRKNKNQIIFS